MFRKNPSKTDQIHTVLLSFVFFPKKFIAEHVTSKVKNVSISKYYGKSCIENSSKS